MNCHKLSQILAKQVQPSKTKYNQVQPGMTKCKQVQPSATKYNQVQPMETKYNQVQPRYNHSDRIDSSERDDSCDSSASSKII